MPHGPATNRTSDCSPQPLWRTSPYSSRFADLARGSHLSSSYHASLPMSASPPLPASGDDGDDSPMMRTCTVAACIILVSVLLFALFNTTFLSSDAEAACGGTGAVRSSRTAVTPKAKTLLEPRDDAELDDMIAGHPKVLVMFMAPWCGHCNACKGDYAKAAEHATGTTFVMADCDSKISHAKLQQYGIRGFPSFLLFINGAYAADFGPRPRTKEDFVKFAQQ